VEDARGGEAFSATTQASCPSSCRVCSLAMRCFTSPISSRHLQGAPCLDQSIVRWGDWSHVMFLSGDTNRSAVLSANARPSPSGFAFRSAAQEREGRALPGEPRPLWGEVLPA